jgi:hypothetical protein
MREQRATTADDSTSIIDSHRHLRHPSKTARALDALESAVNNQQSTISSQQSAVNNQQSTINSQQFATNNLQRTASASVCIPTKTNKRRLDDTQNYSPSTSTGATAGNSKRTDSNNRSNSYPESASPTVTQPPRKTKHFSLTPLQPLRATPQQLQVTTTTTAPEVSAISETENDYGDRNFAPNAAAQPAAEDISNSYDTKTTG